MIHAPSRKPGLVLLFAFLTFTAFYAESFIFTHLEHEHDHDGADGCCALCSEIEIVIMLLEGFGRIACAVLAAAIVAHIQVLSPKPIAACGIPPTPVTLKVRMNS
jgi:hypothetical protein